MSDEQHQNDTLAELRRARRERAATEEARALARRERRARLASETGRRAVRLARMLVRVSIVYLRRAAVLTAYVGRRLGRISIAAARFAAHGAAVISRAIATSLRATFSSMSAAVIRYRRARTAHRIARRVAAAPPPTPVSSTEATSDARDELLEALDWHELRNREALYGMDHPAVASIAYILASRCAERGADEDARALYERTLRIFENAFGPDHPEIAAVLSDLADLHDAAGRGADAVSCRERAAAVRESRVRHRAAVEPAAG